MRIPRVLSAFDPDVHGKKSRELDLARECQGSMLWPSFGLRVAVESGESQPKGLGHYFQKML